MIFRYARTVFPTSLETTNRSRYASRKVASGPFPAIGESFARHPSGTFRVIYGGAFSFRRFVSSRKSKLNGTLTGVDGEIKFLSDRRFVYANNHRSVALFDDRNCENLLFGQLGLCPTEGYNSKWVALIFSS